MGSRLVKEASACSFVRLFVCFRSVLRLPFPPQYFTPRSRSQTRLRRPLRRTAAERGGGRRVARSPLLPFRGLR